MSTRGRIRGIMFKMIRRRWIWRVEQDEYIMQRLSYKWARQKDASIAFQIIFYSLVTDVSKQIPVIKCFCFCSFGVLWCALSLIRFYNNQSIIGVPFHSKSGWQQHGAIFNNGSMSTLWNMNYKIKEVQNATGKKRRIKKAIIRGSSPRHLHLNKPEESTCFFATIPVFLYCLNDRWLNMHGQLDGIHHFSIRNI